MWHKITNQSEIDRFMDQYGGFHDSVLKELKYVSGAYVNEDLSMQPINCVKTLRIVFQRQYNNPFAIEMEFIGLTQLRLFPAGVNSTCEILDATMVLMNDCIYWYDCETLPENDLDHYKGTLISSSTVRWRNADESYE